MSSEIYVALVEEMIVIGLHVSSVWYIQVFKL